MICAATCTDTTLNYKRPCVIWVNDKEAKAELVKKVEESTKKAKEVIHIKQQQAEVAGTAEEKALCDYNRKVQKDNKAALEKNKSEGKKGGALRKGTKKLATPSTFYKVEDFVMKDDGGKGMDALWYAENILKSTYMPPFLPIHY